MTDLKRYMDNRVANVLLENWEVKFCWKVAILPHKMNAADVSMPKDNLFRNNYVRHQQCLDNFVQDNDVKHQQCWDKQSIHKILRQSTKLWGKFTAYVIQYTKVRAKLNLVKIR